MSYELGNKAVVLTGASRGIGQAVALELAAQGARLGLAARDEAKLAAVRQRCDERGAFSVTLPCDVTDDASVTRMVDQAASALGGIDVFMNIAGITLEKKIEDATVDDYRRVMDTNLLGAVRCTRAALPHLRSSTGVLVNIVSISAHIPFPRLGVYACSKWAFAAFSHTLRQELFGTGIRVLTVYPTVVRTDMVDQEPVLARSPSQSPEQCARSIVVALRKGRQESDTSFLPKPLGLLFYLYPPLADRVNRLFLPKGY